MAWHDLFTWWAASMLLGLLGTPLTYTLFARLPGRGYAFSKTVALLLISYILWLGASIGLIPNTTTGVWAAVVGVLLAAMGSAIYLLGGDEWETFRRWFRENLPFIIAVELLFLAAFVGWAEVRSFNPSLYTGEKRMEFTLINGVLNSRRFPPQDPWLAGYSINYYYFGHLMVATLTRLTRVDLAIGFNLAIALWFALAATAFFGLITEMLRLSGVLSRARVMGLGLLGVVMTLFMGNYTILYDIAYQKNWTPPTFVHWLNLQAVSRQPAAGFWPENDWWWFKGARVLVDRGPLGHTYEMFNDFPFISFLIGDLHAQTFSLPFMPVAIALALVIFLQGRAIAERTTSLWRGAWDALTGFSGLGLAGPLLAMALLGGLAVMHPWDAIMAYPLIIGAALLGGAAARPGRRLAAIASLALAAITLLAGGLLLYLPFWRHLQSPGMGLTPNLFSPTRLIHYLIIVGAFLPPIIGFLLFPWRDRCGALPLALKLFLPMFLLPALLAILLSGALRLAGRPLLSGYTIYPEATALVASWNLPQVWRWLLMSKLPGLGLWLALAAALAWILALIFQNLSQETGDRTNLDRFMLLLLLLPVGATLFVEFIYVAEPLGNRVNSIFKFYYLSWELYAISAVYALSRALVHFNRKQRRWALLLWGALLLPVFFYTAAALPDGANHFRGEQTLDSLAYLRRDMPDDVAGIEWLRAHAKPNDIILEAYTRKYTDSHDGIVSTLTGNPTLIGWWDHELHWRGPAFRERVKQREQATFEIYQATDARQLLALLKRWHIAYLYVGNIERDAYALTDANFRLFDATLPLVFSQGGVRIYQVPP